MARCASLRLLGALAVAGGVLACQPLPNIDRGVCGNRIVEAGEDCDSYEEGFACREPGSVNECRFDCTAVEDAPAPACPEGFACGADGVCRKPSGAFELVGSTSTDAPFALLLGDLDASGTDDVVSQARSGVTAFHTSHDGSLTSSLLLANQPTAAAVAELTDDELSDVLLGYISLTGVGVMQGQSDGSLLATPYAPYVSDEYSVAVVFAMDALPTYTPEPTPGDELLVCFDDVLFDAWSDESVVRLPGDVTELAGPPQVGKLDRTLPCEQLAVAYTGRTTVDIVTPCVGAFEAATYNHGPGSLEPLVALPSVALPAGATVTGAPLLTDLNGDEWPDLFVPSSAGLALAFGVGGARFHSTPALPAAAEPDDSLTLLEAERPTLEGPPLAVQDLNGDGAADLVFPQLILVSRAQGATTSYVATLNQATPWTLAHAADFNGDGRLDVITASAQSTLLQLHALNAVGDVATYDVQLSGTPRELSVGDFDGNGISDVVYARTGDTPETDVLLALFGEPFAAFAPEASLGKLPRIEALVPLRIPYAYDAIDDLIITIPRENGVERDVAMFFGSTSRRLVSPYSFVLDTDVETAVCTVAAADFTGDGHGDVAATSTSGQVFMVESTGAAELASGAARYGELAAGTPTFGARLVPIDLEGDGASEALILGPAGAGADPEPTLDGGAFTIARWQDGAVVVDAPATTEEGYWFDAWGTLSLRFFAELADYEPGPPGDLSDVAVVDVTGDGLDDVLAVGVDPDGSRVFTVVENDGDGALDVAGRTLIRKLVTVDGEQPLPTPFPFAVLEADGDPQPEILAAVPGGVAVLELDLPGAALVASSLGASAEGTPIPADGLPGLASDARRITAFGVGDLDGNGVEDYVVGTLSGLDVYRGVPTLE